MFCPRFGNARIRIGRKPDGTYVAGFEIRNDDGEVITRENTEITVRHTSLRD